MSELTTRRDELAEAFAKAQAEIHNPALDSTNPHFGSRFASLAAVRNAVIPVAAKYGIAVVQELLTTADGVTCYTHLRHGSGESWRFGPFTIPVKKQDAHGFGSASSYVRRYSLLGVFALGPEDDDGNAAVSPSEDADATISPDPSLPPSEDIDEALTALSECETLDGLKEVWTGLDPAVRRAIGKKGLDDAKKALNAS